MKKSSQLSLISQLYAPVIDHSTESGSKTIQGTYSVHIVGEDWGCGVDKVLIQLDHTLDSITTKDLVVKERKQVTDWSDKTYPIYKTIVDRQILDAYLCDENGERIEKVSQYIALELYISPNDGSPFLFNMNTQFNTWSVPYDLIISLSKNAKLFSHGIEVKNLIIDPVLTEKKTNADMFQINSKKIDQFIYHYATYHPEKETDILFVWLHGAGEGGSAVTSPTDPWVTLLANKVTALAGEKFQSIIGGAHIFVPQCPTFWMDSDGSGNMLGKRHSVYTHSLIQLIDEYIEEIGAKRVIIGGCSNGGYMTMMLAMECGDKYQAYVPICEAMKDEYISDRDIQILKDLPLYFVYSKDDDVVPPEDYEIPTIKRLQAAGAQNIHVSTTDHVIDTSGKYKDKKGKPYQYAGHWSWIYFDNDETADEDGLSAFHWLSQVIKSYENSSENH